MGGMGMGGFPHGGAGGFGGMGHGYGADAYGYEGSRTQRVLVEDEYGNRWCQEMGMTAAPCWLNIPDQSNIIHCRWYQEMDMEEDEMFDHEPVYGGEEYLGFRV